MKHLALTHFQRPDTVKDPLHVFLPLFNSARYRTRWKHYEDTVKRVLEAGAVPHTIEVAFGHRSHLPKNIGHTVTLRTEHEMFFKENIINVGVQHLAETAPDWKWMALVDADVRWARDDWANETVQRLQHYMVVQMWSEYQDLSANHELIGTMPSFVANYLSGKLDDYQPGCKHYPYYGRKGYPGAPGLAWAFRREAWNICGGLLDTSILGAGDWYMAHGICGLGDPKMLNPKNTANYRQDIQLWWERAKGLKRNVGVVPGLVLHSWHGPKALRKYGTRERILTETQFDPYKHLSRDWQGLWQFTAAAPIELRDRVRGYLHERNEDA